MKELIVEKNEAGQRLDKLLQKYLNKANYGFIQKMLRKKTIVLNDKKADGHEILKEKDSVKIWFSDETLAKFAVHETIDNTASKQTRIPEWYRTIPVIYENEDYLIVNKPAGVLSQKAEVSDHSLVEWLTWYMLEHGELDAAQLESFHPAICNRLDRNTSGLVVCGKSLAGLQFFNEQFRGHTLKKFYHCFAVGEIREAFLLEGFLKKNEKTNTVKLYEKEVPDSSYIKTAFRPLHTDGHITLLEVRLFTGKTHQIRSHLASVGHPIIGDRKYGDPEVNAYWKKKAGVNYQLLHAYRLELDQVMPGHDAEKERVFTADKPPVYERMETMMKRR